MDSLHKTGIPGPEDMINPLHGEITDLLHWQERGEDPRDALAKVNALLARKQAELACYQKRNPNLRVTSLEQEIARWEAFRDDIVKLLKRKGQAA